jgi:PhnB protein
LHSNLKNEGILIMASDSMPHDKVTIGDNVSLSINCSSKEQADEFYSKLLKGGKSKMPMENTFWGAYFGMLTDKFNIHWMFNYDQPK